MSAETVPLDVDEIAHQKEVVVRYGDFCPEQHVLSLQEVFKYINFEELAEALPREFINAGFMQLILCLVQLVLREADIPKWLLQLKPIGAPSVYGQVVSVRFREMEEFMVLKYPQEDGDLEIIQEAYVGLTGTNKLRQYFPNFAYVLGFFRCDRPDNELLVGCHNNAPTAYVIYERVWGRSLLQLLRDGISFKQYLNFHLQVVLALWTAQNLLQFLHHDLHPGNILIRLTNNISLPYQSPIGKIYLTGYGIATIIDYGLSRLRSDNLTATDARQLLYSSISIVQGSELELPLRELAYYYFDRVNPNRDSLGDYIKFLLENYKDSYSFDPRAKVFENNRLSVDNYIAKFELEAPAPITTIKQFFNIYEFLNPLERLDLRRRFDFKNAEAQAYEDIIILERRFHRANEAQLLDVYLELLKATVDLYHLSEVYHRPFDWDLGNRLRSIYRVLSKRYELSSSPTWEDIRILAEDTPFH